MKTEGPFLARKPLLLLLLVVLGWGTSWTVIKFTIVEIPPLSYRGFSAIVAGVGMLGLARLSGIPIRIPREELPRMLVLALFNTALWHALATYGVVFLSSGQAALLGYTMPMWCVPLSIWLLGEKLTARRVVALLLGLGGIAALMVGRGAGALAAAPVGALLMVSAAASWAVGIALIKRWQIRMPTLVLTAWLMVIGSVPLLAGAWAVDGIPQKMPSAAALGGLVFSIVITFMLCNWAWNQLVLLVPVAVSSLSSLLTPLVGVLSGAIFLHEHPGWHEALAAALILGSVAVINLQKPAGSLAQAVKK
jgi:drug/metabolite transporter (DMT)-like permease